MPVGRLSVGRHPSPSPAVGAVPPPGRMIERDPEEQEAPARERLEEPLGSNSPEAKPVVRWTRAVGSAPRPQMPSPEVRGDVVPGIGPPGYQRMPPTQDEVALASFGDTGGLDDDTDWESLYHDRF